MLPVLPEELIDHIFSFLRKDTLALKACSKAHPLFARVAQRYLYANIEVQSFDPQSIFELYQQLSENSHILGYPRTLKIRGGFNLTAESPVLSIMSMIPRMPNVTSLILDGLPCPFELYEDFISTLRNCLQQSSIQHVHLRQFYDFPISVLDSGKYIKKLTLSDCTAEEGSISSSPLSQESLETLIICDDHNGDLLIWATQRVTRLTSLGLRNLAMDMDWAAFPGLLTACSNSLTRLHIDLVRDCQSTFMFGDDHHAGYWIHTIQSSLPFTLSALTHLQKLSIFALIIATETKVDCALPAIMKLIMTAPAVQEVVLGFHCQISTDIPFLGRLDWSSLGRPKSDLTRTSPHIDLYITAEGIVGPLFSPESILDALEGNKALMDLVDEGIVNLKLEWEDWTES